MRIAVQAEGWNGVEPHADCLTALNEAIVLCRELGHEVEEAPFDANPSALGAATLTIIGASTRAALEARAALLGRPLEEEDVEPGTWSMISFAAARTATDYVTAIRTIHATGRALARHMESFDVILSPSMATPPLRLGMLSLSNPDRGEQARSIVQTVAFTQLANAAGNPAMSVPLAWNADGLPIGLQFIGRSNDEATLFRLAGQLEGASPWFDRRPDLA